MLRKFEDDAGLSSGVETRQNIANAFGAVDVEVRGVLTRVRQEQPSRYPACEKLMARLMAQEQAQV